MREISVLTISDAIRDLCIETNCRIGEDLLAALDQALANEQTALGRSIIGQIIANDRLAAEQNDPICQDTGLAIVFIEMGQEVRIGGGWLVDAVNEGVRRGYNDGYLRKSVVDDPLRRRNTGDNTPAVIHLTMVPGDKLSLTVIPKGAGSENMSAVRMLSPAAGVEGVKEFVVDTVRRAGPNPCPPVIVGVGIGGTMEYAALLAKKALLRPLTEDHHDLYYADLEKELLTEINGLGIGPQGFGGTVTALAVRIETAACHIASLPVAVNLNCHVARHQTIVL
jgi:fumarate hydratase subunit alpha